MRKTTLCFLILPCLTAIAACGRMGGGAPDDSPGDPPDDDISSIGEGVLDLPDTPYNYGNPALPQHFGGPDTDTRDNMPAENPVTDKGATLGRVLFYDKALSANDTVACASCHQQAHSFTDPKKFSEGFKGGLTGRSSMSLIEARYYRDGRFFWDERAATLEDQVLMPIQNEVEMGLTLDELVARVKAKSYYPPLFKYAFGDEEISATRISRALAQFVRSIVSYQSPYDEGIAMVQAPNADFPNYTAEENQGKALFFGPAGCARCHLDDGPPHPGPPRNRAFFFINVPTNNGLDDGTMSEDNGVGDITGHPPDVGRFKSPSLRNVAMTAPYMHDGRFATLEEVVEHYNHNVKPHPNLDQRLRAPGSPEPLKLNLMPQESAALVAFLHTLTDEAVVTDPKYSNPFIEKAP